MTYTEIHSSTNPTVRFAAPSEGPDAATLELARAALKHGLPIAFLPITQNNDPWYGAYSPRFPFLATSSYFAQPSDGPDRVNGIATDDLSQALDNLSAFADWSDGENVRKSLVVTADIGGLPTHTTSRAAHPRRR